ncbi:MAG: hypothetical protein JWQ16_2493, partial [Novosphingobium sp.]|nr:hypothetical protein [Novosphingobium sp.]
VKFKKLLNELESPLPSDKESPMYRSENKTMWMALFVLCPRPLREHFKLLWDSKALSTYGVALELRIPEDLVATIMSDSYGYVLDSLIGQNKP